MIMRSKVKEKQFGRAFLQIKIAKRRMDYFVLLTFHWYEKNSPRRNSQDFKTNYIPVIN